MKPLYKIFGAALLVIYSPIITLAQTYSTNTNSTFTTCSGTFYDSGGGGADYQANETYTVTFCPAVAGSKVRLIFSSFNLDNNYDFLTVYDGPNTSAPTMGAYTGTTGPGTVQATPSNTSGCITFLFDSDWVTNRSGWAATISCNAPCQTIVANAPATTPAPDADGIVRICQGESVNFVGSGTFSSSGSGAIYSWNFQDGTTANGSNVNHTFANPGSYRVSLTITDVGGCTNDNLAIREIQVSTTPTFVLNATPDPICLGQTANLTAAVTMTPFAPNCTPPVSGTTFLPDGTGVSYSTSINVTCFSPSQTITAASQIQNICLNIEHSYIGDLSMVIKCPNGQQTALINYASTDNTGCEFLGTPIDVDADLTPGTGANYCFTASATQTMNTAAGSVPCYSSLTPGNYLPVGSFSSLVGCPANGNWTIVVTDNLASDNGYIFSWDLNLNLTAAAGGATFTPTIVSQGWVPASTLTSTGTTTATATPTATGSQCYTYSVIDNFGCTYTQNECFMVSANTPVNAGADVTICSGQSTVLTATGATTYSWSNGLGTGNPKTVTPTTTTTYTVTGTSAGGCITTDQVTVTVIPPAATNAGADVTICAGGSTTLTASGATTYTWSPSTGLSGTTGASVTATPTATITYTVTGTSGSCTSTDQVTVTVNSLPSSLTAGMDQTICSGSSAALTASGATTYTWSPSTGLSGTSGATVTASPTTTTTYTVTGTVAGGCVSTDEVQVIVNPLATANANIDQSTCAGGTITLAGSVGGSATSGTWTTASGSFSNSTSLTSTYTPSITTGTITLTLTSNDPAGPCPSATDQMVITVTSGTPVNAGPDASICNSGSTVLTATGATTYSWSPSTGLSATNTASVTASPTVTTTYSVTGTSASGCVSTDQVTVTVGSFGSVNAGPDQSVCAGASVTLAASGANTYSWDNGVTNGVAFTPTSTTTYTVTGTDASGCIATDQLVVTVNPLPLVVVEDASVCNAGNVTLTATGASTYSWSPGTFLSSTTGSSVIFTSGTTTTYTVTGTSSAGCISSDAVTVTVMSTAAINAGADVSLCNGESTTLTATGGVSYIWDNGLGAGNNFVVSPTATTTYTVTGTDASGCVGTDAVTVTIGAGITVDAGPDQTICNGASITLTATGAATYAWDNGVVNGVSFTPTATTTYTVTGTSASGCTSTDQVTITVNPNTPVNAGPDQTVCAGASVTLTATDAATFSWTGGVINGIPFVPTATTTYTVTGTTAAGCITTDDVTITVNPLPLVDAGPDQVICAGGTVTLTATGAATYTWDNGVINGVPFSPVATVTYTVSGISVEGCINSDQVTVSVNSSLTVDAGPDQTICSGQSLTLSGSGASTYSWDNGVIDGVPFIPNATTTYTVTGTGGAGCVGTDQVTITVSPGSAVDAGPDQTVCAGTSVTLSATGVATFTWSGGVIDGLAFIPTETTTYTVTGTSAEGCVSTDEVTVIVNPIPVVNAGDDLSICIGGSITLTATGAVTYSWDNGVINGVPFSPTTTMTYTVSGTSAEGCISADQVIVNVSNSITVDAGPDQTICNGASVTLTGSGAITYTWDNGVTDGVPFIPTATTTYTVTGTSGAGCEGTDQVTVTVSPGSAVDAGPDQTVCAGTSVTLSASGVTSFSWSNGIIDGMPFIPITTTTYTVTGTSVEGCISTDEVTITVDPFPVVDAGADISICEGSSVTLSASGALTYSWDNGVTDGLSFIPSVGSVTYTVTGTSASGCTAIDQVVVTVHPNPSPIINGPTQYCAGNFAVLSTSESYDSYLWSTGATTPTINATIADNPISVTVTNTFGCIATSPTFTIIESTSIVANFDITICQGESAVIHGVTQTVAGTYSQTFSIGGGCDSTSNVTLIVNPLPIVNAGADQSVCVGESIILSANGAATYTWDNGISQGIPFTPVLGSTTYTVTGTSAVGCTNTDEVIVTVNPLPIVNAGADQTICAGNLVTLSANGANTYSWNNGVTDGVPFTPASTATYTVTGTDINGCVNTDQVIINVGGTASISAGADQTICQGTSVTLSGSGGSTYTWDNGVINGVPFTPTATITYTVTGTTTSGCTGTDQVVVTVNPAPIITAGADQTVCAGASVTLTATGAAIYTWTGSVMNGISFVPTATATYIVTGTSASGCTATDQVVVTVNPLPNVNAGVDQVLCVGSSVTLSGSGATTYTWNNGVINGVAFTPSSTNTYTVTGTDVNGCINADQVIVTVIPTPSISAGPDQSVCAGQSLILSGSGASTYSWSNGVVNGVAFIPSSTTTYTVTGTTATGCVGTDQVTITVNPLPVVNAGPDRAICIGATVILSGSGASSYTWSNSVINNAAFSPVSTATYTVTGIDGNGCTNSDQVVITVNPLPIVNAGADQSICSGTAITLSGSGASTYTWNNGVVNGASFVPLVTNTYTVTGTSAAGCISTDQITITVNPIPAVSAGPDQTVCAGQSVTLSGSGASIYTWNNGVSNGVAFIPTNTATYTVTGTSNGCTATDQVTVTVNPQATVNAGPDQSICIGESVTLTATGANSYSWDTGITNGIAFTPAVGVTTHTVTGTSTNGCTLSDQVVVTVSPLPIVDGGPDQVACGGTSVILNASGASTYTWSNGVINGVAFVPVVTQTYTVTGTSSGGCINTDEVFVKVAPLPTVNAGPDMNICEGEFVTLTASGAETYTWTNGIENGQTFSPPPGTIVFTVTGTSEDGCTATDQVIVNVNVLPSISFTSDITKGCTPLTVTFTGITSQTTGCVWTLSDGTIVSSCSNFVNTFEEEGCFDVTLTVTGVNGCVSSVTAPSMICTEDPPVAKFSVSTSSVTTVSSLVEFYNESVGASSYEWQFGDGNSSFEENPTNSYPEDGEATYIVTMIASSDLGCTDTASTVITVSEELVFYIPNTFTPDGDTKNPTFQPVFTAGYDPLDYSLFIYNRWGEIVFESHNAEIGWDGSYGSKDQIGTVQEGVYTWKIIFKVTETDERKQIVGHVNLIR